MFIGGHFGGAGPSVTAGEPWSKLFGPVLVYLNKGATTDDMYADAQRQSADEQSKWPYEWVNNPEYPVSRGTVSGIIHLTDGESTKGAIIVLADGAPLVFVMVHFADEQRHAQVEQANDNSCEAILH